MPKAKVYLAPDRRWQHVKRGTNYTEIGRAQMQAVLPVRQGDEIVIYRAEHDGTLWARPATEFDDGRFVLLDEAKS